MHGVNPDSPPPREKPGRRWFRRGPKPPPDDKTIAAARTREERAFLPAALEVVETPSSPGLRLTSLLLCAILVTAISWAFLSKVDLVAVAPGKVVPLGQVKVVQPLETSAIRAIYVDDGVHVTAGQVLVELDPTDVTADLDQLIYDNGQAKLDAEVTRVLLTRDSATAFIAPEGTDPLLAKANQAQAASEIAKHLAQISGLEASTAQKKAQLEANQVAIERAKATIPLLNEKFQTTQALWEKKIGLRAPVLESQQQLLEKRAELANGEATTKQINADILTNTAKLAEIIAGFLSDASDRHTKAMQKIATTTQQIAKVRSRQGYRKLISPVSGTVQNVKIHTPGAVVTLADTLMTIVPDEGGIEIDAMIENKDIGFVSEGQEVEIKVDAFPFTRYGLITGKVRKISRDAFQGASPAPQVIGTPTIAGSQTQGGGNAQQQGSELAYPAKITMDRDYIVTDAGPSKILPGMRVAAEIRTGDRRVIDFLLSPFQQTVKEALRER